MVHASDRFVFQAIWAGAGQLFQLALTTLGFFVLVRLLGASAYGIYAIALVCVGIAEIFVGGHVAYAIVSTADLRASHKNALFWALVALGAAAGLILWSLCEPISALFDLPEAAEVLKAAAALPLLTALTSVPSKLLERHVRLSALSLNMGTASIAATLSGIAAAFNDVGPLSLIVMEYVRRIVTLILHLRSAGWMPGVSFNAADTRAMLVPAIGWIHGHAVKFGATMAAPRVIIGAILGPEALGIYVICRRTIEQINGVFSGPISAISAPFAAQSREDKRRQQAFVTAAIIAATLIFGPALLGLLVVAPLFVPVVFGEELTAAVPLLQLMCIGSLRTLLSGFANSFFSGKGDHRTVTRLQWLSLALVTALLLIGAPYGLVGVGVALIIRQWLVWPFIARSMFLATGMTPFEQQKVMVRAAIAPVLMAVIVFLAAQNLPVGLSELTQLVILVAIGAIVYPLVFFAVSHKARKVLPEAASVAMNGNARAAIASLRRLLV